MERHCLLWALEWIAKNVSKRQDLRVLQSILLNNVILFVLSCFRNNNLIVACFKALKLFVEIYYKSSLSIKYYNIKIIRFSNLESNNKVKQ